MVPFVLKEFREVSRSRAWFRFLIFHNSTPRPLKHHGRTITASNPKNFNSTFTKRQTYWNIIEEARE
jgi:hypothetical protein